MSDFRCRLMTNDGQIIDDVFQADSKKDLLVSFQKRGYRPISVEEQKKSIANTTIGSNKLKLKSLILYCRQISTLLVSGVPLTKCFDVIASQSDDKNLKEAMNLLSGDVQSGMVLSEAMSKQGTRFPEMLCKMVEIGELTGDIGSILSKMADQYENDSRINRKIQGAMTYPIVLVFIALGACVFMLVSIVPQFVEVFKSLDAELPLLTKMLLAASNFLIHRWYVLLVIVPLIIYFGYNFFKAPSVKLWIDEKKLTVKAIKSPMQKIMSAQFARTLYTLISSGVPIVQSMEYVKKNVKNLYARKCLDEVIVGIQKGKKISDLLSNYPIFPKLLISMISIGEMSGNLEEMLSKTADYYDEEIDAAIGQITSLLEPIMILIVGLLIGVIVMALYAPMFGMITAMQESI